MTDQNLQSEIQHNPNFSHFSLRQEDHTAVLEYIRQDDTITFTHTGVPSAMEGKGVGSQLARAGLEYARQNGLSVVPLCWFVAGYIKRHPEYQDLVKN